VDEVLLLNKFLQRAAMLALQALYSTSYSNSICPSVCLSVCPSHAGIVSTTARSTVQFALLDWIAKCV